MSNQHKPPDPARLLHELRHNDALQHQPVAEGTLDPQLALLRAWQARRLAQTYADLLDEPASRPALRFFLSDLYRPAGLSVWCNARVMVPARIARPGDEPRSAPLCLTQTASPARPILEPARAAGAGVHADRRGHQAHLLPADAGPGAANVSCLRRSARQ